MNPDELVVCYQASSVMEAKFLVDQLAEDGIKATSDTIDMHDALGPWDGNPRVYVLGRDFDRARQWLTDYDAKQQKRAHHEDTGRSKHPGS